MKKWLLNFMIGIVFFTNALVAEDYPQAVIIFDASGSMWGQIEGKTKIEIARETLKNVLKEWNPAVHLGLTVYGHRSKGNCDDIETVIPVGVVDKEKLIATVISIQPKGKTPISRSLRKVANELKYTEEKATIVLISDGMETCDPDPCETAKGLEKEGIDFVTHVIGFDVDKKTDEQLQCIASATGGEYFSAKNATALNDAMKIIAKKVEKAEPKPVANTLENNIEISASETENGKWIDASHYIYTNENGKAEDKIDYIASNKKNVGKKQLPIGKYIAKSSYNNFKKETAFEIKAGEVTKINLVMGETGNIEISASETENGKWIDASHYIYTNENGKAEDKIDHIASNKKNVGTKQLPVGKYIAKSSYNNFKKETAFEIKAGEVTKINLVMGETGNIEISASETENGKWIDASHSIYKNENGKAEDRITNIRSSQKYIGEKQLPVGKYIANSSYNNFKKETAFEIKAGEVTKINLVMGETGNIEISASETENGKWIDASHTIYTNENGKAEDRITNIRSSQKYIGEKQLPVGKYIANSSYNNFKKETAFEIKAGETVQIRVEFSQFFIESKCSDMNTEVKYTIFTSSGQLVYNKKTKCSDTLTVTLDDGDYSIETQIGSATKKENKFSIGRNTPNKITIDLQNMSH